MRADDQDKSASAPKAGERPADKLFLGPEFATWLYFFLLQEGFEVEMPEVFEAGREAPMGDYVRFAIGKRSTLKTHDGSGARIAISGPGLDDSGELLQAIRRGAYIDVLALQIQVSERVYELSVNADGSIVGLKLPDLFSQDDDTDDNQRVRLDDEPKRRTPKPRFDAADVLALRCLCMDEVEAVIDSLFQRFMTKRLARAWASEDLRAIRKSVAARLAARLA